MSVGPSTVSFLLLPTSTRLGQPCIRPCFFSPDDRQSRAIGFRLNEHKLGLTRDEHGMGECRAKDIRERCVITGILIRSDWTRNGHTGPETVKPEQNRPGLREPNRNATNRLFFPYVTWTVLESSGSQSPLVIEIGDWKRKIMFMLPFGGPVVDPILPKK